MLGVKLVLGVQVYVDAPPPVNVVLLPEHMLVAPLMVKVGAGLTVTTSVNAVAAGQPRADVPLSV